MIFHKRILPLLFAFLYYASTITAQEKPIGYWNSFLPYNTAVGVATDGNNLYVATTQAFFTFKNAYMGDIEGFSKASGMSDIGMQCIAYDMATSTAVLVYSNGNIDLYKNNTFYNIPDLKLKSVTGNKQVYSLYTENGIAYLSTSIGVVVVDIEKQNISEVYQFIVDNQNVPINGFMGAGDYFYAITQYGLYRAKKSSPDLQNFQIWSHIDSTDTFTNIALFNNLIYLGTSNAVYVYNGTTITPVYTSNTTILHLDTGINKLFISEGNVSSVTGQVKKLDTNNKVVDSVTINGIPRQVVQNLNNLVWVADAANGLGLVASTTSLIYYMPQGPSDINSVDIYANNGNLWVAHGGYSDIFRPTNNYHGMSNLNKGNWKLYKGWSYAPFWDTLFDFVSVIRDETNGITYGGSFGDYGRGGVFALKDDGTYKIYKQGILDRSTASGGWEVAGLTLDNNNNLWVSMFSSPRELNVLEKSTNTWYNFTVNIARNPANTGGQIAIDDYGQAWYVSDYGQGLIGYSTNGTFGDISDDASYHLTTGVGSGNLPSNNVLSVVNDKSGNIWVGTDNGIAIIYQPSTCIKQKCDATIPIVQYDQFAGYLFVGENVRTIAVDGADRKWVGTDNGVWLLSHDASTIIYHFTKDNSPLPSNHMQRISVDKVTGDVYFGTDQGLVSYRSTATEGGDTNHNVVSFPNPVPSGYTGSIAIKGLVANADVKITDIDGQLVYHTTAFGGQAIWNGLDYKGHRPQSGVYLIFVTNTDNSQSGTQTFVGKLVILQ